MDLESDVEGEISSPSPLNYYLEPSRPSSEIGVISAKQSFDITVGYLQEGAFMGSGGMLHYQENGRESYIVEETEAMGIAGTEE